MNRARALAGVALLALVAACDDSTIPIIDPPTIPLATQLRQSLGTWGVVPIGPMGPSNPELVALGQALVFDKIMSGNRDISCATCHQPSLHGTDGISLSIGTGGMGSGASRTLGTGRQFIPRNAPTLLNQGLRSQYIFWDGRLSGFGAGPFIAPIGITFPAGTTSILAAQTMLPVLNRDEMRGKAGDLDVNGNPNELAAFGDTQFPQIWQAIMTRLLAIPEYQTKFAAAFPGVTTFGIQHAAAAMSAFISQAYARYDSPFDRFLNRDDVAMSTEAMRGGILFFGAARCSSCHNGPLLGGGSFASTGVPQLGPGTGTGTPLDQGRGEVTGPSGGLKFWFRIAPLRNVELTAPYMHDGAFATLDAVVKHYNDAPTSLRTYDVNQLAPELRNSYHGDSATVSKLMANMDFRMRTPLSLTDTQQRDLVEFLKSLTDAAARDLSGLVPARVPSGLPLN